MHIVVTGGDGYIGYNLVKFLADTGNTITVVSRRDKRENNPLLSENISYLVLDIFADNSVDVYEMLGKPDILIHLAWEAGFSHNELSHMHNVSKHINFIENMLKGGLKHLVITGTMHEIGYFVGEVDENTPTNPSNLYGIAKNFLRQTTEILCNKYSATYQWIRVFYIYGDDIHNNSIFSKILRAAQEKNSTFDLNSGELLYDFIHIDKLVRQISAVVHQDTINGIINCCSGEPVSLKTMVNNFIRDNNLPITIEYDRFPVRSYDSRAIWGSKKKINLINKQLFLNE